MTLRTIGQPCGRSDHVGLELLLLFFQEKSKKKEKRVNLRRQIGVPYLPRQIETQAEIIPSYLIRVMPA
jgi:hypothetical protein